MVSTRPKLHCFDTKLFDSRDHGIYIQRECIGPNITCEFCKFYNPEDPLSPIQGSGIAFGKEIGPNAIVNLINDTELNYCGENGFVFPLLLMTLNLSVENSSISFNGKSGVHIACTPSENLGLGITLDHAVVNGNGSENKDTTGLGVSVSWALKGDPRDPENNNVTVGTFSIHSSQIINNHSGGVRVFAANFVLDFRNSEFRSNGTELTDRQVMADNEYNLYARRFGSGIYIWQSYYSSSETILDNQITDNGHEGLLLFHRDVFHVRSTIRGNFFQNNGTIFDVFNYEDIDLNAMREGANVNLIGNLNNVQLSNNFIDGGVSGVVFDRVPFINQEFVQSHMLLENTRMTSNIQKNAHVGFVMIRVHEEGPPSFGYNNIFAYNDFAGAYILDEFPGNRLCNNIFYHNGIIQNESYGITNIHETAPIYECNLFYENEIDFSGCGASPRIEGDPCFVNDQSEEPNGWQVWWNSPVINRGRNTDPRGPEFIIPDPNLRRVIEAAENSPLLEDDFIVNMDGSDNDIGAYGGPEAIWPIDENGAGVKPLDWDPYCKIDEDHTTLEANLYPPVGCFIDYGDWHYDNHDGRFTSLEADYYRAYADYQIPMFAPLLIDSGVYIDNLSEVDFTIRGKIGCGKTLPFPPVEEPDEDQWVFFTGYENDNGVIEYWRGISMYNLLLSQDNYFNLTYVRNCISKGFNVLFSNSVADGEWVEFQDCSVSDCGDYGYYIYDSDVKIFGFGFYDDGNGDDIMRDNEDDEHFLDFRNRVRTVGIEGTGVGIFVSLTQINKPTQIDGTVVHDCGTTGSPSTHTGIRLYFNESFMNDVTSTRNGCTGIIFDFADLSGTYTEEEELPDVQEMEDHPLLYSHLNDFSRNGLDYNHGGAYPGYCGAEICLYFSSYPIIRHSNISDFDIITGETNDFRQLLYKSSGSNSGDLNATDNFWFYLSDLDISSHIDDGHWNNVDFSNWAQSHITDFDVSRYNYGCSLFNSGEYHQAIRIFTEAAMNDENIPCAMKSLRMIIPCYMKLGNDLSRAREFFTNLIRRNQNQHLALEANLLIPISYARENNFERALELFNEMSENERNVALSIEARLQYLMLRDALNRLNDEADSYDYSIGREIIELFELKDEERFGVGYSMEIPDRFVLTSVYPNPFNLYTRINFEIPDNGMTRTKVFELNGREVSSTPPHYTNAGYHSFHLNAKGLASGTYLVKIYFNNQVQSSKICLIK
ncbi:MAG: T9SS type A sorting domain-containing protein [Candidatus Hatepunaea meridiana]|nr:T9SS type A sorting domain-containing protein [Candidatus Hatepunaea meridiana]